MEIYAIFNTETSVYQCALKQGSETDGGSFDEVGDERWNEAISIRNIFSDSSDWISISEDDFAKYMLGTSGGDNGTGYIIDFSTNLAISAPPAPEPTYEEKAAELQENYNKASAVIKDNYLDAVLSDNDEGVNNCKTQYQRLDTDFTSLNQQLIDDFFNDKEEGEDNGNDDTAGGN